VTDDLYGNVGIDMAGGLEHVDENPNIVGLSNLPPHHSASSIRNAHLGAGRQRFARRGSIPQ
jgi:hypothetical protein